MPGSLNEEGITVPPNLVLSDLDKAFITINYPRKDEDVPDGGWKVSKALDVVQVPDDVASDILSSLSSGQLTDVRTKFSNWNMSVMSLFASKCSPHLSED
jgi:hypothetical protein